MKFEEVLPMLKKDTNIRKINWPRGMYLYLFEDTIRKRQRNIDAEWNPTSKDLLSEEWVPKV